MQAIIRAFRNEVKFGGAEPLVLLTRGHALRVSHACACGLARDATPFGVALMSQACLGSLPGAGATLRGRAVMGLLFGLTSQCRRAGRALALALESMRDGAGTRRIGLVA